MLNSRRICLLWLKIRHHTLTVLRFDFNLYQSCLVKTDLAQNPDQKGSFALHVPRVRNLSALSR